MHSENVLPVDAETATFKECSKRGIQVDTMTATCESVFLLAWVTDYYYMCYSKYEVDFPPPLTLAAKHHFPHGGTLH